MEVYFLQSKSVQVPKNLSLAHLQSKVWKSFSSFHARMTYFPVSRQLSCQANLKVGRVGLGAPFTVNETETQKEAWPRSESYSPKGR